MTNKNKTRIGIISTLEFVPSGGSEDLWYQTAIRLATNYPVGVNVQHWNPTPKHIKAVIDSGCQVYQRRTPTRLIDRLLNRIRFPKNPLAFQYHWFDIFKPDFVLISQGFYGCGLKWMEECSRRNLPYAVVSHLAADNYWLDDATAERTRLAIQSAREIYFVSKANLELSQTQLATRFTNARVVKNPIKLPPNQPPAFPSTTPTYRLAFVGRLEPFAKGIDMLFKVLTMEKWRSREIEVHIFGDGISAELTQKLRATLSLDRVTFRGFTEVDRIWANCHALILPSRMEGLALVMLEAMVRARPVIATDVGGCREVVTDNVNGFVAAAATVRDIDEAMERAWEKRSEWERIGQEARKVAMDFIPKDPIGDFIQNLENVL